MIYPTWPQLAAAGYAPDYLWIGAAAMHALRGPCAPSTRVIAEKTGKEPRGPSKKRYGGKRIA